LSRVSLSVLPAAYFLLPRPLSVLLLRARTEIPARWHEPLDLTAGDEVPRRVQENVEARNVDELLTSPVAGRECIAYQLCVLFDAPGDARPPEWVLQEQRTEAVELGGKLELPPEKYSLESPVEPVGTAGGDTLESLLPDRDLAIEIGEEELEQFLRERGLFLTDGEFLFLRGAPRTRRPPGRRRI